MMKRLFLFVATIFMLSSPVAAEKPIIDDKTFQVCNQLMLNIFNGILEKKRIYPDLKLFTRFAITKNSYGIDEIKYSYLDPQSKNRKYPLEFWVTILGIEDENIYGAVRGTFNYTFPLLNLKIVGFQGRTPKRKQFRLKKLIKKQGELLLEHQNSYMPLRLTLEPAKKKFNIKEDIEIIATLTNVSNKNMLVKDLTPQSVYFLYGETTWGATELDPDEYVPNIVLNPGESIRRKFVGEGFHRPKAVDIYGSYVMTFQGVKPFDVLRITVNK